ncbi:MAG: CDC27 family protein [Phycisphaerae bacterium]|nr:CDC27 family protein [Gemmatimonadaceae bacterium]
MSNAAKFRKKAVEFEQLKQFDRAVASYVRAIEENENANEEVDVALFNKVGDLTLRQGRVTEAVTYYERAVEHYVSNNLFDNAIALCNKILRNAPGRSNVYFTLGRICGRKGLRSDATRNFLEYATRMQQEGRVDEGMRALAEVADLMPELTEVGRLVEEHAARAGITMAPRRRATPPRTAAQPDTAESRSFGLSRDLVFLQIDYEAAQQARAKTPPLQRSVSIEAAPDGGDAPHATAAPAATASLHTPTALDAAVPQSADHAPHVSSATPPAPARTQRLEDLMIFDPNQSSDSHTDLLGDVDATIVDGASILKPYADPTVEIEALNDLETTELKSLDSVVNDNDGIFGNVMIVDRDEAPTPESTQAAITASEEDSTDVVELSDNVLPEAATTEHTQTEDTSFGVAPLDVPAVIEKQIAAAVVEAEQADVPIVAEESHDDAPAAGLDGFTPEEEPLSADDLVLLDSALLDLNLETEPHHTEPEPELAVDLLSSLDFDAMLDDQPDPVAPVADLQAEEYEPVINESDISRFTRIESETLPALDEEFDAESELPPLEFPTPAEARAAVELDFLDVALASPAVELELVPFELVVDTLDDLFVDSDRPTAVAAAEATLVASSRCADLQSASNADPDNFVIRRRLAEALFESGDRDAALGELGAALAIAELASCLPDAANIADELVRVASDEVAHHQKRLELAIRLGDQARLRVAYLDFADTLLRQGSEHRARAVYARVLEIDPWDDRARTALGDAAPPPPVRPPAPGSDDGHVDLADWLRDEDEPTSTRLRMREPDISGDEQDDFNALLRHFKEGVARSLGEDDYESHYDLGVAYKEMGLLDDAVAEFQMALRSRTNRLAAYEALGQCFLEQQSYKVAVTVLSRALHEPAVQDEQRVGVLYLLGYSCEVLQRFDEARGYFQRVYATDIHFRDVSQRLAALDRIVR